jgi:hypothetical protein
MGNGQVSSTSRHGLDMAAWVAALAGLPGTASCSTTIPGRPAGSTGPGHELTGAQDR